MGVFGQNKCTEKMPCEDESTSPDDISTRQEMPKIAGKPPAAVGETWKRFSQLSEKIKFARILISHF